MLWLLQFLILCGSAKWVAMIVVANSGAELSVADGMLVDHRHIIELSLAQGMTMVRLELVFSVLKLLTFLYILSYASRYY
jgi:hypothetical protein